MASKRVACLLAEGFEDSEFEVPVRRLRDAGIEVEVIGERAGEELPGKKGKVKARTDRSIDEVRPEDYDALLLPGGHSPDQLRADERFVSFVRVFDRMARPVAAVCHGPQLLISAGLVKGRTLTAWKTIQEDLRQIGAKVKDQEVVRDQNWITSRQPDDLEAFSAALLQALGAADADRDEGDETREPWRRPSDGGARPAMSAGAEDERDDAVRLKREAAREDHEARAGEAGAPRGKL